MPKFAEYTIFQSYVYSFFEPAHHKLIPGKIGITPIGLGRIFANPGNCSNVHLLRIANLLEQDPYHLIKKFGLGMNKLKPEEIDYYKAHQKIQAA